MLAMYWVACDWTSISTDMSAMLSEILQSFYYESLVSLK